jgi:hypothetical protein
MPTKLFLFAVLAEYSQFQKFYIIFNLIKFDCFLCIYASFAQEWKLIIVKFPEFL